MKIGRKNTPAISNLGKPVVNQSKKTLSLVLIIVVTLILIVWVNILGKKAENTVDVVMLSTNVYKNQVITESMLKPYSMLAGEFEKYSVTNSNGVKKRRILTWEERNLILNSFAAYPLKSDTYAEYRDFIKSRTDNSDNVLYSFPGKDIIPLQIGSGDLQAFKTFLQPGDRLNIEAVFSQRETVTETNDQGNVVRNQIDSFKTITVFSDIMIADLLNSRGESILDIYASYNDKTVWEQARLDASQAFKDSVEPKSLIVALTPEEKERYYYFLKMNNIEFKASMPQRVE